MAARPVYIAPSILSADFMHLGTELASVSSADFIHFDVMDGHFVPNLTFGPYILSQLKAHTTLPLDVHLMVSNPEDVLASYLSAGADYVSFHFEAQTHANRLVSSIHEAGAKAACALNPATPVSFLEALIEDLDMVLIMSVNPGFAGQSFIDLTYKKLAELKRLCAKHHVNPLIEVDGGVCADNAGALFDVGADILVTGSYLFKQADRQSAIFDLKERALRGKNMQA